MAAKSNGAMPTVQGKLKTPKIPGAVDWAAKAHVVMKHGGAKAGKAAKGSKSGMGGKC